MPTEIPSLTIQDPCGAADFKAMHLIRAERHEEALEQLANAIDACEERSDVTYRALDSIAYISRIEPRFCSSVWELHARVPRAPDAEYLRASIHLDLVCPRPEGHDRDLEELVLSESDRVYGPDAAIMAPFVRECEKARALRSACQDADHLRALTVATRLLCDDEEVLRHGVRASVPDNEGACTAAIVPGYWYLLRTEPPDDDVGPCLERVLVAVEPTLDRYPMQVQDRDQTRKMFETLRERF